MRIKREFYEDNRDGVDDQQHAVMDDDGAPLPRKEWAAEHPAGSLEVQAGGLALEAATAAEEQPPTRSSAENGPAAHDDQ